MTDDTRKTDDTPMTEGEVSNVDLQFMGRTDTASGSEGQALTEKVEAESKAPGQYKQRGMDEQDVAVAQSMDASDPPSTNMGDATSGDEG